MNPIQLTNSILLSLLPGLKLSVG